MSKAAVIKLILALVFVCGASALQAGDEASWRAMTMALSADGRFLAVHYNLTIPEEGSLQFEHEIWLYDLDQPLTPPRLAQAGDGTGYSLLFSPDGALLAAGSYDGVAIYRLDSLETLFDLRNSALDPPVDFRWIAFSPDGDYLMAFTDWWPQDHDMHVWHIETGQLLARVDAQRSQQPIERPWLSPDWKHFVRWHADGDSAGTVYNFDPETGGLQARAQIDIGGNGGAAFSPDSSLFALSTRDGVVKLYETDNWTLKNSIKLGEHSCDELFAFGFSHGGSLLAMTCRRDYRLSVWDYESGELVAQARTYGYKPRFTRDDARLVLGTRYSGIQVLNLRESMESTVYPSANPLVHPNGELMLSIGPDGYVWIWNIALEQLQLILPRFAR